jgi:hypothetical protein
VGSIDGFAFALTPDQSRTIETQRSRNEVQSLQAQIRQMNASVDQKLSQLSSSMRTGSPGTPSAPGQGRRSQRNRRNQQHWDPTAEQTTAATPAEQKVSFVDGAYPGGKGSRGRGPGGKGGRGRGRGKGGEGKGKGGKGRGYISPAVNVALKHVYGEGANFYDVRTEWLSQWSDPAERKKHCFLGEKLAVECNREECPKCFSSSPARL